MDAIEVSVDDVGVGGDGIAHADDGRVVFVKGGVPGDRVRARVLKTKKRYLHAEVERVLQASADRVEPPCPHVAAGCGGCGWQHLSVDGQRRWKVRLAEESLRRIGRLEGHVDLAPPLPTHGFRTTVRCAVDATGRLGFRKAASHDVVAVDSCLVAHPALERIIAEAAFPGAAEVTLRVSISSGECLAVVAPAVPSTATVPEGVTVVGADDLGSAGLTEVVAGRRFAVSAGSFFQTRTDGAEALVDAVRLAGADAWGSGRLVDLYCGVGLFAATLGEGMEVIAVEGSRSSVADAERNLAHLDATVVRASVERWRPSAADIVVADPPRAGLGADGVEVIAATGAARVVAVHCDAGSFGRDAGLLDAAGYRRASTVLVDLFPHTPHVELVSGFERDDR